MSETEVPPSRNPNQGTEDAVDKTRWETTDTNASADALHGGMTAGDEEEQTDEGVK